MSTGTPLRSEDMWNVATPAGSVFLTWCKCPGSRQLQPDVVLVPDCPEHDRLWYWCPDLHVPWCDGGPPDYPWHTGHIVPGKGPGP